MKETKVTFWVDTFSVRYVGGGVFVAEILYSNHALFIDYSIEERFPTIHEAVGWLGDNLGGFPIGTKKNV